MQNLTSDAWYPPYNSLTASLGGDTSAIGATKSGISIAVRLSRSNRKRTRHHSVGTYSEESRMSNILITRTISTSPQALFREADIGGRIQGPVGSSVSPIRGSETVLVAGIYWRTSRVRLYDHPTKC